MWFQEPDRIDLKPGEVHVWRASLDLQAPAVELLRESLAADERERAERFRVPVVRARFIAGRATLRNILGRLAGCPPSALQFAYGEKGKPYLVPPSPRMPKFNLSHSHGLALYAVSLDREIGIDLEMIRQDRDHEKLARRFFSPIETAELMALPAPQRLPAFFDCWTRKEAYLKARGQGLAVPLASFDVSLAPGRPAALLSVAEDPDEVARWFLHSLDPADGFAATLAVEGQPTRIQKWAVGESGESPGNNS
jgi:4'-phosphopantetheinyl transferase